MYHAHRKFANLIVNQKQFIFNDYILSQGEQKGKPCSICKDLRYAWVPLKNLCSGHLQPA